MFIQGCAWAIFTIVTELWHEGQHRAVHIYIYFVLCVLLLIYCCIYLFVSLLVLLAGGGCTIFKLHHINIIS